MHFAPELNMLAEFEGKSTLPSGETALVDLSNIQPQKLTKEIPLYSRKKKGSKISTCKQQKQSHSCDLTEEFCSHVVNKSFQEAEVCLSGFQHSFLKGRINSCLRFVKCLIEVYVYKKEFEKIFKMVEASIVGLFSGNRQLEIILIPIFYFSTTRILRSSY